MWIAWASFCFLLVTTSVNWGLNHLKPIGGTFPNRNPCQITENKPPSTLSSLGRPCRCNDARIGWNHFYFLTVSGYQRTDELVTTIMSYLKYEDPMDIYHVIIFIGTLPKKTLFERIARQGTIIPKLAWFRPFGDTSLIKFTTIWVGLGLQPPTNKRRCNGDTSGVLDWDWLEAFQKELIVKYESSPKQFLVPPCITGSLGKNVWTCQTK